MKTEESGSLDPNGATTGGYNTSVRPEKSPNLISRTTKRILELLKALWRATFGRLFGSRQVAAPTVASPERIITEKPSMDGLDIEIGMGPEQESDLTPTLESFDESPELMDILMLEDKEYGVNYLESGTRALVAVEDGRLLPAEERLLLETSEIRTGMPPQNYMEVPKIRIDEQVAPIVNDPVGHFPYPVLLQMNNLIDPAKILEGFGVEASEDGSFKVGEHQLRIQKAENGEHVITEIGSGRALPAGNVSLVQLCRSEAGMEVIDQRNTASLLYDRFVAGNMISENGIQEIEAPASIPSVEALAFAAQAVGAPEILANLGILPNAEKLDMLPADSPIVAIYDNVQDEDFPMALVYVDHGDDRDPVVMPEQVTSTQGKEVGVSTEMLLVNKQEPVIGALNIVTTIVQNHHPDLTIDQAHQMIHERMSSPEQSNEAPEPVEASMDM